MSWIFLLLKLVSAIMGMIRDRRLIGEGERKVLDELKESIDAKIAAAQRAADDVRSGRVPLDPNDPNDRVNRSKPTGLPSSPPGEF